MAILEIGSSHSRCLACGRETGLDTDRHDTILGYGSDNGNPGCGEVWTEVRLTYGRLINGVQTEPLDASWISDFIKNLYNGAADND